MYVYIRVSDSKKLVLEKVMNWHVSAGAWTHILSSGWTVSVFIPWAFVITIFVVKKIPSQI